MEPTFFLSFLICLPIGLNTRYRKFHLFLSALRFHLYDMLTWGFFRTFSISLVSVSSRSNILLIIEALPYVLASGRTSLRVSLVAQLAKNPPAMQETLVESLGQEDRLEKGKATHSVFWPGESHGQRSLAGYSPWGGKGLDTTAIKHSPG